jgi:DNA repair photolyase
MSIVKGSEKIVNPLQRSALKKKGLCDYVINIASGCLHGCTFCYVPSTPAIRTRQDELRSRGISDPQMNWGEYLLIRENIPEKLDDIISRKRVWDETPEGKGVVLMCSGTDPYQNKHCADISTKSIEVLMKHKKRVRILTRGLLWTKDLDILSNPNIIIGMSIPHSDDDLSFRIEPHAPSPTRRYQSLVQGHKAGCRVYVAMAPTPPTMTLDDFKYHLDKLLQVNPEVIFWEPINARGTNGKRMVEAGLDFAKLISHKKPWSEYFIEQWNYIETAATELGCIDKIHIWPDPELKGYVNEDKLNYWFHRPTVEKW